MIKLKIPYSEVETAFRGSKGRIYLRPGAITMESGGQKLLALFVQDDNDSSKGYFQLDYSPRPDSRGTLMDYLGPKPDGGWTHPGERTQSSDGLLFVGCRRIEVKTMVGDKRQDGRRGGNLVNDLTGKNILRDQNNLVAAPTDFIYVSWNPGSSGWFVAQELEQPNEIGRNWAMNCLFPLPQGFGNGIVLEVFGKTKKLKFK
jgi:hypothetical protein